MGELMVETTRSLASRSAEGCYLGTPEADNI